MEQEILNILGTKKRDLNIHEIMSSLFDDYPLLAFRMSSQDILDAIQQLISTNKIKCTCHRKLSGFLEHDFTYILPQYLK